MEKEDVDGELAPAGSDRGLHGAACSQKVSLWLFICWAGTTSMVDLITIMGTEGRGVAMKECTRHTGSVHGTGVHVDGRTLAAPGSQSLSNFPCLHCG